MENRQTASVELIFKYWRQIKRNRDAFTLAGLSTARKRTTGTTPHIVKKRAELRASLAEAEGALADAVEEAAKADGDGAEAKACLDLVRARCLQIRTALIKIEQSESIAPPRKWIDPRITLHCELPEQEPIQARPSIQARASIEAKALIEARPSRPSSERAVLGGKRGLEEKSRQPMPIRRLKPATSAQEPRAKDDLARSLLVRQSVGLLLLTLAYLQYFFIDVQLQIVSLPTTVVGIALYETRPDLRWQLDTFHDGTVQGLPGKRIPVLV